MQAIRFTGEGQHALVDLPEPDGCSPGEVLIEVAAIGICGSDLLILSSPQRHPATPGIVLGHEFAGTVRAVGDGVGSVRPGDHVVIDPARGCGLCRLCRLGRPEGCPDQVLHGIFQDGGMRRYATLPEWATIRVAESLAWRRAVLTEPLSCVLRAVQRARPGPGESAAVLGAGPIGQLFVAVLARHGLWPLAAYEPAAYRREMALVSGATHVLDSSDLSAAAFRSATGAASPPSLVVDATGILLDRAVELVDHAGTVLCFGYNQAARPPVHTALVVDGVLRIQGSAGGFGTAAIAARLLEGGELAVDHILSEERPLTEIDAALADMRAGRAGKVVLRPAESS
jgi:threonine dehydrogenase-like Zn-dependent dehydrogenase